MVQVDAGFGYRAVAVVGAVITVLALAATRWAAVVERGSAASRGTVPALCGSMSDADPAPLPPPDAGAAR